MFKPAAPGNLWTYQYAPNQVRGHSCLLAQDAFIGLHRPSLAARLASGSGVTVCCADTSQMMSLVPQLGSVTPFKLTNKVRPAVPRLQGLHLAKQL